MQPGSMAQLCVMWPSFMNVEIIFGFEYYSIETRKNENPQTRWRQQVCTLYL